MKHELPTEFIQQTIDAVQKAIQHGHISSVGLYAHWLNIQMADKYVKPEPDLKILVTIEGGQLSDIKSTRKDVNITVIDLDNYSQGYASEELCERNVEIAYVSPGYIEERIVEINKEYPVLDNEEEN